MKAETGAIQPQATEVLEPQKAGKGKEELSSRALRGTWTFGLPNCEKIKFCCFQLLTL
jgi:hypothetical protein